MHLRATTADGPSRAQAEAYHTERPSLNYLFRRCRAFRFACGRQFVMPEMEHEGAFPREEAVPVAYGGGRSFGVVPRRDGSQALGAADRARLGLGLLDQAAAYGAGRPLRAGGES